MSTKSPALALAALNTMPPAGFAAALGDIFEDAPWVAEGAAAPRPFATVAELHDAMLVVLAAAPPEAVAGFLNHHPDLAGPAARMPQLTAHSSDEQAGAGVDEFKPEGDFRLVRGNAGFRARVGFPLIIFGPRHTHASDFSEFSPPLCGHAGNHRRDP